MKTSTDTQFTKSLKRPTKGFRVHVYLRAGTCGDTVASTVVLVAGGKDLGTGPRHFKSREEAESYKERVCGYYASQAEVEAVIVANK